MQRHRRKQLFLNTKILQILHNKVQRYLTELWRVRMLEQSYEKTIIKLKRAWELLVYLLIKMKNIKWRSHCTVCLEGYVFDIDATVTFYQYWACYMYMEYKNHWLYQLNYRKKNCHRRDHHKLTFWAPSLNQSPSSSLWRKNSSRNVKFSFTLRRQICRIFKIFTFKKRLSSSLIT